jgi:hypothetical protein
MAHQPILALLARLSIGEGLVRQLSLSVLAPGHFAVSQVHMCPFLSLQQGRCRRLSTAELCRDLAVSWPASACVSAARCVARVHSCARFQAASCTGGSSPWNAWLRQGPDACPQHAGAPVRLLMNGSWLECAPQPEDCKLSKSGRDMHIYPAGLTFVALWCVLAGVCSLRECS